MKYLLKIKTLLLISLFIGLISCNKKESTPPETLSTLTAEQQKVRLDQEGTNFINHLEDLEKPDLMNPMAYFVEIAQNMDENQFKLSMKVGNDFILSSKRISGNSLKSANDAASFKKVMDDNQGTYTYSRTNKTWIKTAATGKVEFVFPASETTTTNNASFVFSNLSTVTVTNADISGDLKDLPKSLDIAFKVDNILKYAYNIECNYDSNNIPTHLKTTLTISAYKFVEEYSLSNNKVVSFTSTMSKNDIAFISMGLSADGNFTNDLLTSENTEAGDVLSKVNAYFQIENVKVSGNLDFANLATKIKVIDKKYENQYNYGQYPKAYYEECVSLYKASGTLNILFADKNEVFAKLVPYVTNEYSWYDIGFKVVFTDGSQLDDSYFDSGFNAFVDKLNTIIDKINNDYDGSVDKVIY